MTAVEDWVKNNIPSLSPPFTWVRLEGGHSNLTYLIEDSKLSDELRQLEGMTLEVTGIVVGEFENAPVLAVDYWRRVYPEVFTGVSSSAPGRPW